MTQVLQISDTHLVQEGALVSSTLDTAGPLRRLVVRITELQEEVGALDAIIVSGDVSDDGSHESYELFKSILSPLNLPTYAVPGNHDQRASFRTAFSEAGYLPNSGKLNWHKTLGQLQIIGLDTLVEGQGGGELDAETLDFLEAQLRQLHGAPVIVMFHHPPFDTGIAFMDTIGLNSGGQRLQEILAAFSGDLIVVCGHVHRNISTQIGGHAVMTAPSVCSSFLYNIHNDAPVGFLKQEGGVLLHRWHDGFKSIRIEATRGDGPFAF